MRPMHNNRRRNRGYNRNNNSGGNRPFNRNQAFDSVNPAGGRLRGTAQQLMEKYQELARAAAAAGDHTLAENQLQHAEHYARVLNEHMEAMGIRPDQNQSDGDHGDDEMTETNGSGNHRNNGNGSNGASDEQPSLGDFEPPEFLRAKT